MNGAAATPKQRAVFLSDVHLGSKNCHAAELANFLEGLRLLRHDGSVLSRLEPRRPPLRLAYAA